MMIPDATKQSWTPSEDDDVEVTEEEVRVNEEVLAHPTRDDWHEQRERGQKCEGVLHARCPRPDR